MWPLCGPQPATKREGRANAWQMQIPRPQTRQAPSSLWLREQASPQPLGAGCLARSSAVEKFGC